MVAAVRCHRLAGQTVHGPGGFPPWGGQAETGEGACCECCGQSGIWTSHHGRLWCWFKDSLFFQVRRQVVRLANLSVVMVLRRLSISVAKRFPTFQHLVQVWQWFSNTVEKSQRNKTKTRFWTLSKSGSDPPQTSHHLFFQHH